MNRSRSAVDASGCLGPLGLGELECGREPDRAGDVLGAAASPALLPAAVQQRLERHAAAHREDAGSLRRAELVPGERDRVRAEVGGAQRQPAGGLHGVDVQRHAATGADAAAAIAATSCTVPTSLFA